MILFIKKSVEDLKTLHGTGEYTSGASVRLLPFLVLAVCYEARSTFIFSECVVHILCEI